MTAPIRPQPPGPLGPARPAPRGGLLAAIMQALTPPDATATVPPPAQQMATQGITDQQRGGFQGAISRALYHNVIPYDYGGHGQELRNAAVDALTRSNIPDTPRSLDDVGNARDDAWRLYLGLPQHHGAFAVSSYTPTQASGNAQGTQYFAIPSARGEQQFADPASLRDLVQKIAAQRNGRLPAADYGADAEGVMGHYQLSKGQDQNGPYVAYYDKWDLDPGGPYASASNAPMGTLFVQSAAHHIGKPFEIYDRIYYDPKTFAERPAPPPSILSGLLSPRAQR